MKRILCFLLVVVPCALNAQQDSLRNWFNSRDWFKTGESERTYDAFGRVIEKDAGDVVNTDLAPHSSTNIEDFAKQYKANPSRWNKAFAYLQFTDFSKLDTGRYQVDGENVFALITIASPKSIDSARWEAHKNYNDIHYVISGKEKIGIAPLTAAIPVVGYNSGRDIAFYKAKGDFFLSDQKTFFIVTTNEVHAPGVKADGDGMIKKLVIKVKRN